MVAMFRLSHNGVFHFTVARRLLYITYGRVGLLVGGSRPVSMFLTVVPRTMLQAAGHGRAAAAAAAGLRSCVSA